MPGVHVQGACRLRQSCFSTVAQTCCNMWSLRVAFDEHWSCRQHASDSPAERSETACAHPRCAWIAGVVVRTSPQTHNISLPSWASPVPPASPREARGRVPVVRAAPRGSAQGGRGRLRAGAGEGAGAGERGREPGGARGVPGPAHGRAAGARACGGRDTRSMMGRLRIAPRTQSLQYGFEFGEICHQIVQFR